VNDRLIGRAGFLGLLGVGAAGLFYGRDVQGFVGRVVPQQIQAIVPTGGWRIDTIGDSIPNIQPAAYRLAVGGMVGSPKSFTLGDLKSLPRAEQVSTFHCVTGWIVNNVHWAGFRIKDLLDEVKPQAGATAIRFTSAEPGYNDSLTLDQAMLDDVMLAYEMDGGPLSRPHGAPLRLVIPEMYGYKNVKWVTRMELLPHPAAGYWEQHGYDANAWVGRSNGHGFRA
jgi:DMSO/TMAO reductase YedYZ molybdopterin-dependent catalytic subunit